MNGDNFQFRFMTQTKGKSHNILLKLVRKRDTKETTKNMIKETHHHNETI